MKNIVMEKQAEEGVTVQVGTTIITVWDATSPDTEKQIAKLIKKWIDQWLSST